MIRSIALVTALLASGPALAGEPVMLRENVTVDGAQITLGDLFEVDAERAGIVVARAPAPGARGSLDVNYVRRTAAQYDLDWANSSALRRVAVSRSSRAFGSSDIASLIEGELFATEGQVHEVRLANSALTLHAPIDSAGMIAINALNFDPRTGMMVAEITPYEGASPVRVTGRAFATVEIPVLARPVAAGDTVSADDIGWLSVRGDRLRADALLDPEALIGLQARRALSPNQPLRGYDLQRPMAVQRGEIVTLLFNAPGIQLTARARALESAPEGEFARFVNLSSNRTIEALVDAPGQARVGFGTASF